MNKDRIMELTEILNNPDLHGYLPNVCNELLQVNIELQKKAELGEHYKHLYSEVKKQKDDVVEYVKNNFIEGEVFYSKSWLKIKKKELLRMLGEINYE